MQSQLGSDYAHFLDSLQEPPVISLRLNCNKLTNSPFANSLPVPWHPDGFYLSERPVFTADPYFHAGGFYVQEASSMLLYQLIDFSRALNILDLCAAPGGKSTLLAAAMPEDSLLIANEVVFKRAKILRENLSRWGSVNCVVTSSAPKAFARLKDSVDVLVVDAPCSGEGLFRKNARAITQWSVANVRACALRQKQIVADSLPCLRAGGTLIYSTCTYTTEENEAIISWLLKVFPELELYPKKGLEKFGATPVNIAGVANAAYFCYPHRFKGEGLFIARLRRRGKHSAARESVEASRIPTSMQEFLKPTTGCKVVQQKDKVYLQPKNADFLQESRLRILKRGLYLGKMHRSFIPSHELALSTIISNDLPTLDLSYEDAIGYLRKEELELAPPIKKGWLLAQYKGANLGWFKATNKRLNNYYPVPFALGNLRQKVIKC